MFLCFAAVVLLMSTVAPKSRCRGLLTLSRITNHSPMRKFLNSPVGQILTGIIVSCGLVALYYSMRSSIGNGDAIALSRDRVYVDATTLKPYNFVAVPGDPGNLPAKSPSGVTGYPAEPCYWTADGQIKENPTYVLLKKFIGQKGPTFCPDCGRLVVEHNPAPIPGQKPPATEKDCGLARQAVGSNRNF